MKLCFALFFFILYFFPSKVFCQHNVWISDKGDPWTELGLTGIGTDTYWQEGQGEKYREISRLENSSGITEIILDCPSRNCRFKLDKKGAFWQYYDNSSVWNLFLNGGFIPATISNVDFYKEEKQIVLTYSLSSSELNSYYDITFELQDELDGKVIIPKSLVGEYDCVKAENSGDNYTIKIVKWNALLDGINLSGKYRLLCYANPSSKNKIIEKQALEKKIKTQEEELKQKEINLGLFLNERANTIYNYCQLQPNVIRTNESLLETIFQQTIDNYSDGLIDVNFSYKFDTLGFFYGNVMAYGNRAKPINKSLALNHSKLLLSPSIKNNMFVKSECRKNYNLNWSSSLYRYRVTKKNIKPLNHFDELPANEILNYFNEKNHLNDVGVYSFTTKKVSANSNNFYEIRIKKFKNNTGPLNVFFSMLLPGLGTNRVTYKQEGNIKMIYFLLSATVSGVSKYYSNQFYQKYQNATSIDDLENNYMIANNLNKVYLISGGIGATIYIYDFFYVLSRGFKNKTEQRRINSSLKNQVIFKQEYDASY